MSRVPDMLCYHQGKDLDVLFSLEIHEVLFLQFNWPGEKYSTIHAIICITCRYLPTPLSLKEFPPFISTQCVALQFSSHKLCHSMLVNTLNNLPHSVYDQCVCAPIYVTKQPYFLVQTETKCNQIFQNDGKCKWMGCDNTSSIIPVNKATTKALVEHPTIYPTDTPSTTKGYLFINYKKLTPTTSLYIYICI